MKRVLTAAQMRAVEAAAASHGLPAAVLMETAGRALAERALRLASAQGRFAVVIGPGNNGGDGLVAARTLLAAGRSVWVASPVEADQLRGDAARNLVALRACGVDIGRITDGGNFGAGDIVIDALFGTGLHRAPEGACAEAIARIQAWRAHGALVLCADLPSGLDSDTGVPLEPCVQADVTLSFGCLKPGHVVEPGASRCGTVELVDLGLPSSALATAGADAVFLLEEGDVRARLPRREAWGHKGTFGHVLVVAGSRGKTGAGALAGLGALRAGSGLVTVAARPEALADILRHAPELMGVELDAGETSRAVGEALREADEPWLRQASEGKDAVVLGPGIARGTATGVLLQRFLAGLRVPCVVDADGLNALAPTLEACRGAGAPLVLTPHPGEMARLLGSSVVDVQAHRLESARSLAERTGAVVVLKGAGTVVTSPAGVAFVNRTGNAGMASAGTGDVLAGLCGGFLAQGVSPLDAALVAVYVHGMAGDLAVQRTGQLGLVASDLLAGLQSVWAAWRC